jgi:hypothetical protein
MKKYFEGSKKYIFIGLVCYIICLVLYSFKAKFNDIEKAYFNENLDTLTKLKNTTLQKYIDIHTKQVNLLSNASNGYKVSLNKSPNAGYANRIYSFLSSLLTAILTDSAILVAWNFGSSDNIGKYIDTPFEQIFISNRKYKKIQGLSHGEASFFLRSNQSWIVNKNMNFMVNSKINESCSRFFYDKIEPVFMELCCNRIYFKKLLYYNLVSNKTVNSAIQALSDSTKMDSSDKQHALFKVGYEVGGNLLNLIWMPKAHLKKTIDFYIEKEFKDNFVIGIQLRYHYLNKIMDVHKFIECALQIEQQYLMLHSETNKTKNIRWFIASDSQQNLDEIFSYYPKKAFTANGTITHVNLDPTGYEKAILDVELLSRCDEMIMTGGSSFGFIAGMKSLKMPYYVNGFDANMKSCRRNSLGFRDISKTPSNLTVF